MAPTWKYSIETSDKKISVVKSESVVVDLNWEEITKVEYSKINETAVVYASKTNSDIVIPGKGLAAPYVIENKQALLSAILEHVDQNKVMDFPKEQT